MLPTWELITRSSLAASLPTPTMLAERLKKLRTARNSLRLSRSAMGSGTESGLH